MHLLSYTEANLTANAPCWASARPEPWRSDHGLPILTSHTTTFTANQLNHMSSSPAQPFVNCPTDRA